MYATGSQTGSIRFVADDVSGLFVKVLKMKKSNPFGANDAAAEFVFAAESAAQCRHWDAADQSFLQAIALDPSPASRIAYGVCLSRQERFFEAISVFTPILEWNDNVATAVVCHNLAGIYREVGNLDLARRFQWRATLLQEGAEAADLLAMANEALAGDLYEAADSLLQSAFEMDENHDIPPCANGDLIATEGLIVAAIESPAAGVFTLLAAYRQHQATRDLRGMGADQLNLSHLFRELKRDRAARKALDRAIRHFKQAPAPESLHRAQQQLEQLDRTHAIRTFNGTRN